MAILLAGLVLSSGAALLVDSRKGLIPNLTNYAYL